jgi:hypothetical protein
LIGGARIAYRGPRFGIIDIATTIAITLDSMAASFRIGLNQCLGAMARKIVSLVDTE